MVENEEIPTFEKRPRCERQDFVPICAPLCFIISTALPFLLLQISHSVNMQCFLLFSPSLHSTPRQLDPVPTLHPPVFMTSYSLYMTSHMVYE